MGKSKNDFVDLSGLLEVILKEVSAGQRRQHEEKLKELAIIQNSALRDEYAQHLLLDKFLAPVEAAQQQMQQAANRAQWLAEVLNYYFNDYQLSQEDARLLAKEFRILAIRIMQAESLYDLKLVYTAATLFADQVAPFKHWNIGYSLEHLIRTGILEPLHACIATERNFQRRVKANQTSGSVC